MALGKVKWKLFLSFVLTAFLLTSFFVVDINGEDLTDVNVGIVEQDNYAKRDDNGVLRGFDAEYLARIAGYAGFDLHYVFYDNYGDLLGALAEGSIDLTTGVAKTSEREDKYLFADTACAVGTQSLYVRQSDDRYSYGNINDIAGMKLGAVKGTSTITAARTWAKNVGITLDLNLYNSDNSMKVALDSGAIDGICSNTNVMKGYREIYSFTTQSYYIVLNKNREDLKNDVDSAMNRITRENSSYAEDLHHKYQKEILSALTLTEGQKEWLGAHEGSFKVAVITGTRPYYDGGEGVIPDLFDIYANTLAKTTEADFEYVAYASQDEAIKAVVSGEADILGLTHMDASDALAQGLVLTSSVEDVKLVKATRTSAHSDASHAAVIACDKDIIERSSAIKAVECMYTGYDNLDACYHALSSGQVDAIVATEPELRWLANQHRTGVLSITANKSITLSMCAAVSRDQAILGEILSQMNEAAENDISNLLSNSTEAESGLLTTINRLPVSWLIMMFAVILLVVVAVIFLIVRTNREKEQKKNDAALIASQQETIDAYERDRLTGLYNRDTAIRRANEILKDIPVFTTLLVSVDNLWAVNESYGHDAGNDVIKAISSRLIHVYHKNRDTMLVARYDTDTFLVFVKERAISDNADPIMHSLLTLGLDPVRLMSNGFEETIWPEPVIGVATGGDGEAEESIRNAALALTNAVERGTSFAYYTEEHRQKLVRSADIRDAIIDCLAHDGFKMVYQPQVDLKTREVSGYEALVRMKDGRYGPGEFISEAENAGLMSQLGRQVTRLVVEQIARWRVEGVALKPVSLNYSSSQLGDTEYADYLLELLADYNVDPSMIKIEITESLLIQADEADQLFARLQGAGIRLLMDDFGTGYSSLNYLTFIPFDVLKLDKSLVDVYLTPLDDWSKRGNNAFIYDIINLTHHLKKKIIVEGVEEGWQVEALVQGGCDIIQGYYFSKPIEADEVKTFKVRSAED